MLKTNQLPFNGRCLNANNLTCIAIQSALFFLQFNSQKSPITIYSLLFRLVHQTLGDIDHGHELVIQPELNLLKQMISMNKQRKFKQSLELFDRH